MFSMFEIELRHLIGYKVIFMRKSQVNFYLSSIFLSLFIKSLAKDKPKYAKLLATRTTEKKVSMKKDLKSPQENW